MITPPTHFSNRLYIPYTNAELPVSVPMTSEIREVAVLSMIARPTP